MQRAGKSIFSSRSQKLSQYTHISSSASDSKSSPPLFSPLSYKHTTNINFDKILNACYLSALSDSGVLCAHFIACYVSFVHNINCIMKNPRLSGRNREKRKYKREYFEYNLFSLSHSSIYFCCILLPTPRPLLRLLLFASSSCTHTLRKESK